MKDRNENTESQPLTEYNIYEGSMGTLASRIDRAWKMIKDSKNNTSTYNPLVLYTLSIFLKSVLNISLEDNDGDSKLKKLMEERKEKKGENPEYIPGLMKVNFGESDFIKTTDEQPFQATDEQTLNLRSSDVAKKAAAAEAAKKRAPYRVDIRSGKLMQGDKACDTSSMVAYGEIDYAAFIFNKNGELSVFNQNDENMGYSVIKAGPPVVAAGVIKIENGILKSIVTLHGEYKPTLSNVYNFLAHLKSHNVNLGPAMIFSKSKPSGTLKGLEFTEFMSGNSKWYQTSAHDFYFRMKDALSKNIDKTITSYQSGGILSALFELKDKVTGSSLTGDRAKLATTFKTQIEVIKNEDLGINEKINKLDEMVKYIEGQNEDLSRKNNKNAKSGRLASSIEDFKKQLEAIKNAPEQSPEVVKELKTTLK